MLLCVQSMRIALCNRRFASASPRAVLQMLLAQQLWLYILCAAFHAALQHVKIGLPLHAMRQQLLIKVQVKVQVKVLVKVQVNVHTRLLSCTEHSQPAT